MNDELYEAISRLKAWIRDFRRVQSPVFIKDLENVIGALQPSTTGSLDIRPWCTKTGQNACSCHERDGAYVCEFCRSQGMKGFMQ